MSTGFEYRGSLLFVSRSLLSHHTLPVVICLSRSPCDRRCDRRCLGGTWYLCGEMERLEGTVVDILLSQSDLITVWGKIEILSDRCPSGTFNRGFGTVSGTLPRHWSTNKEEWQGQGSPPDQRGESRPYCQTRLDSLTLVVHDHIGCECRWDPSKSKVVVR